MSHSASPSNARKEPEPPGHGTASVLKPWPGTKRRMNRSSSVSLTTKRSFVPRHDASDGLARALRFVHERALMRVELVEPARLPRTDPEPFAVAEQGLRRGRGRGEAQVFVELRQGGKIGRGGIGGSSSPGFGERRAFPAPWYDRRNVRVLFRRASDVARGCRTIRTGRRRQATRPRCASCSPGCRPTRSPA